MPPPHQLYWRKFVLSDGFGQALLVIARVRANEFGVRKSTTSMSTGPSDWDWKMNFPSNFSDVPSNTVSTIASARSFATGSG